MAHSLSPRTASKVNLAMSMRTLVRAQARSCSFVIVAGSSFFWPIQSPLTGPSF